MGDRIVGMLRVYLRTRWAALLQLSLGSIVFSFLFASIPIFQEVSLYTSHKFELDRKSAESLSVQTVLPNRPLEFRWYAEADRRTRESAKATIDPFVSSMHAYGDIQSGYVVRGAEELRVTPSSPQAVLQFSENFTEHVRIVEGSWPVAASKNGTDIPLAIGRDSATLLGVTVDSHIRVIPDPSNIQRQFSGVIRAIVEPRDPSDIYWLGYDRITPFPVGSGMRSYMVVPVTLEVEDFLNHVGSQLAPVTANYWWYGIIDKAALENIPSFVPPQEVKTFESRLNQKYPRGSVFSGLDLLNEVSSARDKIVSLALHVGVGVLLSFASLYFFVLGNIFSIREFRDYRKLFDRGMSWTAVMGPSVTLGSTTVILSLGLGIVAAMSLVPRFLAWRFRGSLEMDIAEVEALIPVVVWSIAGLGVGIVSFAIPFLSRMVETALKKNAGANASLSVYLSVGIIIAGAALSVHGATSGTEKSEDLIASNISIISGPAMILLGASLLCAQSFELLADLVRIRLGSLIPQHMFIMLALLKTNASSTIPLLALASLAVMIVTLNGQIASSVGIDWGNASQAGIKESGLADPVIETILNGFGMGCFAIVMIVSVIGVAAATTNAMKGRQEFVGIINSLGYSSRRAWQLVFIEAVVPLGLCMAVGFMVARAVSQKLSPVLWSIGDNKFVTVVPDSSVSVEVVLGTILGIEMAMAIAFFLARAFRPKVSLINDGTGGSPSV